MKRVLTVLLVVIALSGCSQEPDGHMQYVMARIELMPPAWSEGLQLEEVHVNHITGQIVYKVLQGSYWKLHKETLKDQIVIAYIKLDNVLYQEKMLFIWMDKGVIKQSFNGIKGKHKDIMPLYKLNIVVSHEEILCIQTFDMRGMSLKRITEITQSR